MPTGRQGKVQHDPYDTRQCARAKTARSRQTTVIDQNDPPWPERRRGRVLQIDSLKRVRLRCLLRRWAAAKVGSCLRCSLQTLPPGGMINRSTLMVLYRGISATLGGAVHAAAAAQPRACGHPGQHVLAGVEPQLHHRLDGLCVTTIGPMSSL